MALAPIWKDYNVTLATSGTSIDYEIRTGSYAGTTIYAGRAYPRPGETNIVARINDICADYLAAILPHLGGGMTYMANAATFYVVAASGGGWAAKDSVTFYNDWSYDEDFNPSTMALSDPIRDGAALDPRQVLMWSVLPGPDEVTFTLNYADGSHGTIIVPVARTADFNNDFNNDFSNVNKTDQSGTAVLDLAPFTGLASVSVDGHTFPVLGDTCRDYALYYVNAYGGWDSLLLEGRASRRADLTRHTMHRDYDNADRTARGIKDYAVEVAPGWVLNTGILTDDESARMHHVINSTEVYLCDLTTGRFHPVILTETAFDVQTDKAGGRPPQYTLNATLAREQVRR